MSLQARSALNVEYENIKLEPCVSTGRPGTPARFFAKSWEIDFQETHVDECHNSAMESPLTDSTVLLNGTNVDTLLEANTRQIVHQHANGICIVTAGHLVQSSALEKGDIDKVVFVVQATSEQSVGAKRKRATKASKKISDPTEGKVGPKDTVCQVFFRDGSTLDLKACVAGTILEINENLTQEPTLLVSDPLLNGYIAVISPSCGYFPPDGTIIHSK
jgi:hypothetical protein